MVEVIEYLKEVFSMVPNMAPDDRDAELATVVKMIESEMKRQDERVANRVSNRVEKIQRENHRLKILLGAAADTIEELQERNREY